jgi:hypothetical protein
MRLLSAVRALLFLTIISPSVVFAQSSQFVSSASVPRLIKISGVFRPANGQPAGAVETVTLSIYTDSDGGAPLWQETQTIALDDQGRYSLLLGATQADGVPAAVFGSGDAQWLGTVFERTGEVEGPRVRITSVPYALRASDADTLGGRPAADYVLAAAPHDGVSAGAASDDGTPGVSAELVLAGTPNFLAKYVNGSDVGNSAIYEANGMVGVGTTTPLDYVHARFTDPGGATTGLAVQNLGNTATSYSGMLFYDQNGALGQFQGFNNVTHEYRINNIARVSPGGAFNGSINFMLGGASKFIVAGNGNIGIGTTTPSALLEVSNAIPGGPANMWMTSVTNAVNPYYMARRARGTPGAATAVQNGDGLAGFYGEGYGATGFGSGFAGGMTVRAAQNWTDTAHGTALTFATTSINATASATRMTLDATGNLGIGTTTPSATVEAVRSGDVAVVGATSFNDGCCAGFVARMARGTAAAPAAVQLGDPLALFQGDGYGATDFSSEAGGMVILAVENFTDTAQGTAIAFTTTPLGSTEDEARMAIMPDGNVGIGTFTEIPTIVDKLQVFGDIRVGTTGTNGCLKRFDGNFLVGTCSSDRRLKKNITPFGPMLDKVTALQPVHYFWRASEFPERHFGDGRAYGLIAQEVEQTLPELVVTDADGFKAVDYSQLPLLTIQAVKDLKSENDALKQRVSELERLVNELLATTPRR